MRIKVISLIMAVVMILTILCACENNNVDITDDTKNSYGLLYQGINIVPGEKMETIKNSLGEPNSYYESVSCAFEGMDKIYTYGSIQITTYTEKEIDYVYTIVFLDDGVSTSEGLYIGADASQLINIYGEFDTESNLAIYKSGETSITVGLRDNMVVSIVYGLIN